MFVVGAMFLLGFTVVPLCPAHPCESEPVLQAPERIKSDAFAINMFREIVKDHSGNVIFSPASVENVLRLVRQGACGKTAAELDALPMGKPGVPTAMQPVEATALFIGEHFRLKSGIDVDEVIPAPFMTNREQAARQINSWANQHTRGMIPSIINSDSLSRDTRVVAANAIALEEKWLHPFNPDRTAPSYRFTCADGQRVSVNMMFTKAKFRYAEGEDWKAVALFYRTDGRTGEPSCFLAILPKFTARDFAMSLSVEKFSSIRRALAVAELQEVWVGLPRFEQRTATFSLVNALKACGLQHVFSSEADFSAFSDEPLMLAEVLQRCYVKTDEQGVKAAAVTVATMNRSAAFPAKLVSITFNRPFIWAITDLTSPAAPYFMGLFERP